MADLVYGMAMSRVLKHLRTSMIAHDITSSISIRHLVHQLVEVSFVDDVAIPVTAHASEIVSKSGCVARCVHDVFRMFGMTLNFKPGKSEGIVGFFGPASRVARASLAVSGMQTPIGGDSPVSFRFVSSYQHVGTCIAVNLNMCEEVTKRCGIMRAEASSLSAKIFKSSGTCLQHKVLLLQSYILSKGTNQCGAWAALPDVQYKRFHKCILDVYRAVCGHKCYKRGIDDTVDVPAMFTDDDVIFKYGFMNPRTMLRLFKLTLFSRIVTKAPPLLLELIRAQGLFSKGWVHSFA